MVFSQAEENIAVSPSDQYDRSKRFHMMANNADSKLQNESNIFKNRSELPGESNNERYFAQQQQPARQRGRALTHIYGSQIYKNSKNVMKQFKNKPEKNYAWLQDNIGEINDSLLKMMPLLKNISRENLIPIIDFESQTQSSLNYLLLHVYGCIPSVGFDKDATSTVALKVPGDQCADISHITKLQLNKVTVKEIKRILKHHSSKLNQNAGANENEAGSSGQPNLRASP
jgi:hypothetical protein